jgi:branched-chain amino acid transport system substrate-binding protein
VIGSEGAGQWFYESPMYFPQTTHGNAFYHLATYGTALVALPAGKTKLGSTACVEIEACGTFDKEVAGSAKDAGFDHVFRSRASVAQPDYSAECLSARNAGVQVWLIAMDGSSVIRLAQGCARQGFRPTYATLGSIAIDRMKDEPNLEGTIVSLNAFPHFQSGTPATDEFQRVIHASKVPLGAGSAVGWVSAKLFEKAAANMPEPPTADAVLRGLWSLKDDTLGGLTIPLTFPENQPEPVKMCWFTMVANKGAWTTPNNYKLSCVPTK